MFFDYIRLALRNLFKSWGYTLINVFGFSVGLAATMLIVLWATHELNYENFFGQKDRIFQVLSRIRGTDTDGSYYTPYGISRLMGEEFPEIEAYTRMENYSHFETCILEYQAEGKEEPLRFYEHNLNLADSAFFRIFDYAFIHGSKDLAFRDRQSIVLSRETAEKFFGKENPVGETLVLNGNKSYTVSGVVELPSNSQIQFGALVVNETLRDPERLMGWDSNGPAFALVREGVDIEELDSKILTFLDDLDTPLEEEVDVMLVPIREMHSGYGYGLMIYIMLSVGVLILVIACLNYVNLSTALLASRAKLISLFKLAGARRKSVFILTLFESNIVVLLSLASSLLLAWLFLPWFERISDLPLGEYSKGFLLTRLPWIILLILVIGTLSGLIPATRFSLVESIDLLQAGRQSGRQRRWPRLFMVTFQFLISISLITTTALIFQQRKYVSGLPLGFEQEHIIEVPINDALIDRFTDYSRELMSIPGVVASTAASTMPAGIGNHSRVQWGSGPEDIENNMKFAMVMPGYFKTFGMQMEQGRPFSNEEPASLMGYIVNQAAMERMGLEDAIGHHITFWGKDGEIVGVVKDFQNNRLYQRLAPLVLSTQAEHLFFIKFLFIRLEAEGQAATIRKISEVTRKFAPEIPFDYSYIAEEIQGFNRFSIRYNQIFMAFSLVSVFIAMLGLLGMSLYSTARRTKEIGIRKIHGARTGHILQILLVELYTGVGIAMTLAVPLVWLLLDSWLRYFANRTRIAWWIFLLGGLVAVLFALVSVGYQTMRAASRNPVEALRYE